MSGGRKGERRLLWAVEALVLAPVLAAVIISALLLFGVPPSLVFAPGHFVLSLLDSLGLRAHNRVGVIVTVLFWWAVIVGLRLGLRTKEA